MVLSKLTQPMIQVIWVGRHCSLVKSKFIFWSGESKASRLKGKNMIDALLYFGSLTCVGVIILGLDVPKSIL